MVYTKILELKKNKNHEKYHNVCGVQRRTLNWCL